MVAPLTKMVPRIEDGYVPNRITVNGRHVLSYTHRELGHVLVMANGDHGDWVTLDEEVQYRWSNCIILHPEQSR